MAERTVPHRIAGLPLQTLRVEVTEGPDRGKVHVASGEAITVGTAPGNDLVLVDDTVSRYHLELERRGDRIWVRDHGSTNGVAIGNTLVERASIAPGTVLVLGKTSLRVDDGAHVQVALFDEERFGGLLGRTQEMRGLMARLARASESEASVMIVGETGTGKELVARALHEHGRPDGAFEIVDCAAMLPALVASELFGHEANAFPGADRAHVGALERARGGTLFLHEVGELSKELQAALLSALERKAFRRLGGHEAIGLDARIVSSSTRDLRSEVNTGRFRPDLFYRLSVVSLRVPPLRERAGDVPLLVEHFLRQAGHDGRVDDVIPPSVMQALTSHHWPGNARELRNFVEAALALGEAPSLNENVSWGGGMLAPAALERLAAMPYKEARNQLLHVFETDYLKALMARTHDNVSRAAREAQMNRSYLIEMLQRHRMRSGKSG